MSGLSIGLLSLARSLRLSQTLFLRPSEAPSRLHLFPAFPASMDAPSSPPSADPSSSPAPVARRPPSSNSLGLLMSAAPLAEDWNKENLPVPIKDGGSPGSNSRQHHAKSAAAAASSSSKPVCGGLLLPPRPPPLFVSDKGNGAKSGSPSNLLKRPLMPLNKASPCFASPPSGEAFTIKRRRGLLERSVSVEELGESEKWRPGLLGLGASPDLVAGSESPSGAGASPAFGPDSEASPVSRAPLGSSAAQQQGQAIQGLRQQLEQVGPMMGNSRSSPSTPLRRGPSTTASAPSSTFGRQSSASGALSSSSSSAKKKPPLPALQRYFSVDHAAQVKRSFELGDRCPDLTGDSQRRLCLPVLKEGQKHPDLRTITASTAADLLRGKFDDSVASYRFIDARYKYEFDGGHIRGAENFGLWDEQAFFSKFLPSQPKLLSPAAAAPTGARRGGDLGSIAEEEGEREGQQQQQQQQGEHEPKRDILIFHCEFSSARGPALMKELRKR